MWLGLDLGQHLGHHCGLGWIGSQSWGIGLDLENWTHVQLWYESTMSCDCDAVFAGFINRLCRNYKRQCRRANGRSSQRPKLPYWSHSRWLVVSLTLYTLSICLCRMFALWDVLGSHVTRHIYNVLFSAQWVECNVDWAARHQCALRGRAQHVWTLNDGVRWFWLDQLMLMIGTGTNCCYVEDLDKVELWAGDTDEPKQVCHFVMVSLSVIARPSKSAWSVESHTRMSFTEIYTRRKSFTGIISYESSRSTFSDHVTSQLDCVDIWSL